MTELVKKVEQYADKHDLTKEEKAELGQQLVQDQLLYGNCYLDMEEGRIKPSEAQEKIKEWESQDD